MKKIKEYIYLYGNLTSVTGFAIYWRLFNQFTDYLVENNIVQNIDLLEDIYEDYEIADLYYRFIYEKRIEHVVLNKTDIVNSTKYSETYKKQVLKDIATFDVYKYDSVEWNFEEDLEVFDKYQTLDKISFGGTDKKEYKSIDETIWMLKFENNLGVDASSYRNNVFSEYISCQIIESLGIDVQETKLGYSSDKLVVGCKNFLKQDEKLIEFDTIATECLNKSKVNELDDIINVLENSTVLSNTNALKSFYTMCVVDAFLGNYDRHIRNWGYIVDSSYNVKSSPIYDCGSCLFSKLSEKEIEELLNENKINEYNNNFPKSAIFVNGRKISYFDLFKRFSVFNDALHEVLSKINMNRVYQIINTCELLSDDRKEFYKKSLLFRYNKLKSLV